MLKGIAALSIGGVLLGSSVAFGDALTLTAAGSGAGFALSTFASGFPTDSNEANGAVGPLGIAFVNGGVLVSDAPGNLRFFSSDTDGQTVAGSTLIASYGHNNALGLAKVGSTVYMTQQVNGHVVTVNPTTGAISNVANIGEPTGITVDPTNGHLFVSTYNSNNVFDIDPAGPSTTLFTNAFLDGLSTDGTTLYGANPNGNILGFNIVTHAQVFDSGPITGDPDGTALGTGTLAGNIFVNTNAGSVIEINLATKVQTVLATGGIRGDFVMVDPNGTLLLDEQSTIYRLTAPDGGTFGTSTPLPSAVWGGAALLALLGANAARRRISSSNG
jgi:hypothetical protein